MNQKLKDYVENAKKGPKEIHFESSSRCNAFCLTCPREGMTRYQGEMSWGLFVKGVDEVATAGWHLDYFHFHLNGEPLFLSINELCARINYADRMLPGNPTLCFFTNASLLTPEVSAKILESKLNSIVFSVDGGNKEAFERCRPGLKWETVVGNIKTFMKLKFSMGSKIRTQTAFIPQAGNKDSLREYYPLFRDMGVDDVGGSGVNNIGGLIDSEEMRLPAQYIKGNIKSPCWRIFIDLSVCADGIAVVCCQDVRQSEPVGDLNTMTLPEIWNGKRFTEIRDAHLRMAQEEIPFCKKCDYMKSFVVDDGLRGWWPGTEGYEG